MLTLACSQESCRRFPAREGVFPQSVPETSCGNTQEKLGSMGCFGVACSKAGQWSVQGICEITSTVWILSVFSYEVFTSGTISGISESWNCCPQSIAEGYEKHMNVRFGYLIICSGIYLFPLTVFLTLLAVRLWLLTASLFLLVGWAAVLPWFGAVIVTVLPVEVLRGSGIWELICRSKQMCEPVMRKRQGFM